jgi:hypothetical protein
MGWKVTAAPDLVRRVQRIRIAEKFPGWTLEYIDALSMRDRTDIFGVLSAESKVNQLRQQTAAAQQSARSKRGRRQR